MGIRALPPRRLVPWPLPGAGRVDGGVPALWPKLHAGVFTAARATGDLLLRFEAVYALPAIVMLLLHVDAALVGAWNLEKVGGGWWHALRLDRGGLLLPALITIPLVPWIVHGIKYGRRAIVTGPDLGLLLYLTGAQIGYVQTLNVDGSKTRLLGVVGATLLYYLICHTTKDLQALRRWLAGVVVASCAGLLLTLSLLAFHLPDSRATSLVQPVLDLLRPLSLGPVFHLYFFETSQRTVANPNGVGDYALVIAAIATTLALRDRRLNRSHGETRWRPHFALCTLHFALRIAPRVAWGAAAAAAGVIMLGSGARTALLGYGLSAGIVLLHGRRRWLAAAVPLALAGALLTAIPAAKTLQVLALWRSDAAVARLQVWSSYWGLLRESPLLGTGLGLYSVALEYSRHYGLSLYFTDPHAHNVVLQTYLEQTALGLAGLGAVLYAVWWNVRRSMRTSPPGPLSHGERGNEGQKQAVSGRFAGTEARTIALAAWAAIGGLVLHNLFDINLNTNLLAALLFALAALALRASHLAIAPAAADDGPTPLSPRGGGKGPGDRGGPAPVPSHVPSPRTIGWAIVALLLGVAILGRWLPPYAPHIYVR